MTNHINGIAMGVPGWACPTLYTIMYNEAL